MSRIYNLQDVIASPAPLAFEAPREAQSQEPSSVNPASSAELVLDRAIARRLVRRLPDLDPSRVEGIVNRTRVCHQIKLLTDPAQDFSEYFQQGGTFSKVSYVAEALLHEHELRVAASYDGNPNIGINANLVVDRLEKCVEHTYGTFGRWLNWFTFYIFCHSSLKKAEELIKANKA